MRTPLLFTLTLAMLALFTGGCVTILFIVVPFWYTLSPTEFMDWFTAFGPRIGITMLPMEVIPLVLSMICFFHAQKNGFPTKGWIVVCAANILMMLSFFIYFLPVNLSFLNHTINVNEVGEELARWEAIHTGRTILAVVSTGFAVKILKFHLQGKRGV